MISIIAAIGKNNVIGKDNKLLWHIPEDLKHFKQITLNSTIIMGRKTFESLPGILPKRDHIILTQNKNYYVNSPHVKIVNDCNTLLSEYSASKEEVFIIGGGEIYNIFINYCSKLYITKVNKEFNGDTFFPNIDYNDFNIIEETEYVSSQDNIPYKYLTLKRKA